MSPIKFLLVLLLLITRTVQADQSDDFLAARDAYRSGDADKLALYSQHLQKTPLEVYTSYYQLRIKLDTADIAEIRAFLARPDDTPLLNRLRGEWLKSLGKKQQWELFDSEYPHVINADTELNCYAMQSRIRTRKKTVLDEVHDLWFTATDMPDNCTALFEVAIKADVISQQDIVARVRLALEAGNLSLAKSLTGQLTGNRAMPVKALDQAMDNPGKYLKNPKLASYGQRAVALFALQRLAKLSPDLASERWEIIEQSFPEKEQHYFLSWLAYEAARKQDIRALKWFKQAGNSPQNEQQLAWHVRTALRIQDWGEVLSGIHAMTETQRNESAWRYWQARALQASGRIAEAKHIFLPLSAESSFYGQLAAEELADTPVLSAVQPAYQPGKQELSDITNLPGIQRALTLYRMNIRVDALQEWNWAIRKFSDQELITAAEIARRNEMYDRAISTAEKTVSVHDFSLRYLAPYRSAMHAHIEENHLDEAWVYGLMRQESRFVTTAKSGVGASGLMQVMPTTARWIAKKLGLKDYKESLLHQLETNLTLGTYYMKTMLSSLDDSPVLASAAYNAGPGRARRWRADAPLEGAIYTETIPFDETRDYVKKVMSNTVYYARQFGDPPRSLKVRIGIINGKTGDTATETLDDKSPAP